MARVLDEFPEHVSRPDGKYPWSEWADGRVWQLEQGSDFETKIGSFRQTCAKYAQRKGMESPRTTVMVEKGKTYLVIQFYPKNQPGRRRKQRT